MGFTIDFGCFSGFGVMLPAPMSANLLLAGVLELLSQKQGSPSTLADGIACQSDTPLIILAGYEILLLLSLFLFALFMLYFDHPAGLGAPEEIV